MKGAETMKSSKGFTLIEMLVVLAIIGVLMGALLAGYGHVTRSAQKARAQELVSNVATALNVILMHNGVWPADRNNALKTFGGQDGNGKGCLEDVALVFAGRGVLGVNASSGQLKGVDRFGIVSPWAQNVIKRSQNANANSPVPSGGTIRDHVVYFAIDDDLDGITEAKVCGEKIKVRANAIAWSAGADGKLGSSYHKRDKQNIDNVYSWSRGQEVKDK